jgi:MSHA pilin protein MshB
MKRFDKKGNQKGFTIIELVVVILLLGILTATALPRFIDVTDKAHDAAVDGVLGGLGTGVALFRAQWYADNQPATVSEFGGLLANAAGYPMGVIATVDAAKLSSSNNCVEIFQSVLQPAGRPSISTIAADATVPGSLTTLQPAVAADFVAYLQNDSTANQNICYYFYVGQQNNPSTADVPAIVYDARDGSVTRAVF